MFFIIIGLINLFIWQQISLWYPYCVMISDKHVLQVYSYDCQLPYRHVESVTVPNHVTGYAEATRTQIFRAVSIWVFSTI